ncbi:MAG: VWA domain-containing protein [Terracidiphilus sp.]
MSRTLVCSIALISLAVPLRAQTAAPDASAPVSTLRINSRAVLVDVIVTDRSGKPVSGLTRDAFTVTEQSKPQAIDFFEEHTGALAGSPAAAPKEMPKLPPDVFSNFSPFPEPAAVNVLLLDSLNTRNGDLSFVHSQVMKFLKDAKPGTRTAIFTMGMGLHFIQGFNDDPAVLAAALCNKKNNGVESSVMLKGLEETTAQESLIGMMSESAPGGGTAAPAGMISALQDFMNESDTGQSIDRKRITLVNLQRLAAFLEGFPGRKNLIWFAESVPSAFVITGGAARTGNPASSDEIQKTMAMLAAARVAIYPVYAPGVWTFSLYKAENNLSKAITQPSQLIGPNGAFEGSLGSDASQHNAEMASEQILAEQSGGRAFATNGMSEVIEKVTADSSFFYTLSYSPTNAKMDGNFRNIEVKIPGGKYSLSYRQGYFAMDAALPGSAMSTRNQEVQKLAAQNPGAVDPLLPFMDLGMPQSEQILLKVRIVPAAAGENEPAGKKDENHYKVDFSLDLKDLDLKLDSYGLHKGELNLSLIAYDRYGKVASRKENLVELNIKPDAYAVFQQTGVQMHAEIGVPKGQYWLRTGVYDQGSHKVGTMEVALSSVVPLPAADPMEADVPRQPSVPLQPSKKGGATPPTRSTEKVTVEQLEQTLAAAHGKKDQDLAKRLGGMELSERLSSPRLQKIQADLPGEKSRMALLVLADASAFLQLPAAEIPATPPPDLPTQKLILSRAAENLVSAIHKLPDFFARQTTTRFHDLKVSYVYPGSAPVFVEHQAFQPLDSFSDTVSYRDGKEVEEPSGNQTRIKPKPKDGLVNSGVFGQLQRLVVTDIYMGKMKWSHWEERATGPIAVFQYSIAKEKSTYVVNFCCVGAPNQPSHNFQSVPPFHGEIAIDPATGAVYRLVIITELSPTDPIFQAEVMVEYERVEIGGQTYVCPRKSVTITTAVSSTVRLSCIDGNCFVSDSSMPKDTSINDTEYDSASYHVFRSEMRVLPAGDAERRDKTPANNAAPAPSGAPGP